MIRKLLASDLLVYWICGLLILLAIPTTPGFASLRNASNLLAIIGPLLLLAIGQTLVMIGKGIDLSVTGTMALVSVLAASVMSDETGWLAGHALAIPVAVFVAVLTGIGVGWLNGLAVAYLKMPPFMVTLTMMMFLFGFATWFSESKNIGSLPIAFTECGASWVVTLPGVAAISILIYNYLNHSIYGRWLYATGQNQETAAVSGVPANRVLLGTYVIAGILAALAALIYTAQLETGSPVLGQNLLLDVIGAVVIGGTSLFGGRGKLQWTLAGVLLITLIDNLLNLQSLSHFSVMIAKGAIILAAAYLDVAKQRWSAP